MREFTSPPKVTVTDDQDLTDMVFDHAARQPDLVLFSRRTGSGWTDVTAAEFGRQVTEVAKGLLAAGVGPGERVGLLSKTRYEWTLVDYAIWTVGAVTVPIYETSSAEQVQWILSDSGAVGCVVETADHQATVESIRDAAPALREVWHIDGGGITALIAAGADVPVSDVATRRAALRADDPATIIYTSGTTGRPKGCLITHRNMLYATIAAVESLDSMFRVGSATLLFLPLAHVFARVIETGAVYGGTRLGHTADLKNLLADFAVFQPTFLVLVPRVLEKVYNSARQRAHADGKGKIFDMAEQVAIDYSKAVETGGPGLLLRGQHAVFDRLVYGKLRAALGSHCHSAISGSAPLGDRLTHFFRGIGLQVLEGYGLTETSAAMTVNLTGSTRLGTVGRPIAGSSVRIAEDGEILLKGENIFSRYWNNDAATQEAIDADGWFHSGDIGDLDSDGYLRITGRKKELIITAGGKNVAPAVLEDRLCMHWLISQAVVVGDRRPYIGVLITIDPDTWPAWKDKHGKPADATVRDLHSDGDLAAEIQAAIDEANKAVSRAESIRKFRILEHDFTEASGELTPSLKIKRHVVMKDYADDVEALYSP